jgi:hypothetical protein
MADRTNPMTKYIARAALNFLAALIVGECIIAAISF